MSIGALGLVCSERAVLRRLQRAHRALALKRLALGLWKLLVRLGDLSRDEVDLWITRSCLETVFRHIVPCTVLPLQARARSAAPGARYSRQGNWGSLRTGGPLWAAWLYSHLRIGAIKLPVSGRRDGGSSCGRSRGWEGWEGGHLLGAQGQGGLPHHVQLHPSLYTDYTGGIHVGLGGLAVPHPGE